MPVSFATVTTTNMELTPMRVTYNAIDLGGTLGNVTVETKYTKSDIKADQLGTTVLDRRVSGFEAKVSFEIAETENFSNWKVVFPHSTKKIIGGTAIDFESKVGDSDISNSFVLLLHPLSRPNSDLTHDYTFTLACASAESSLVYSPTGQLKMKVVMNILPDTSVTPAKFYRHGDPAVT